jgi:hypothetical protein
MRLPWFRSARRLQSGDLKASCAYLVPTEADLHLAEQRAIVAAAKTGPRLPTPHQLRMLEIVARAHGASVPRLVAERIDPDCPDIPAAIERLRVSRPQWFQAPPETPAAICDTLASAARAAAGVGAPVPIRIHGVAQAA